MKRLSKYQQLVLLSACVILPFSNTGLADEVDVTTDTSKWVCKFCTVPFGWSGAWDMGLIYVDDPTPKFSDYRGLDDDGAYLDLGGNSNYRDEKGNYIDFYANNLGLDSRSLQIRGGKQGTFELRTHYSEIPRYMGHGTQTPYLGVGTDTLVLPASGQEPTLAVAKLESKRETLGAGLTIKLGSSWQYDADFEQQKRNGTRTYSSGLFVIGAAFMPAPIDFTTNLFNMGLEYASDRSQLRLEFVSSEFNNGNDSLTWDNPFARGFGEEVSRSALEPDNQFYQFSIAGAFRFSPRLRISGKAAFGSAEQDDAFLPYTINPAFEDLALPRDSLNGKVETSMFNLSGRLYARLADRLVLTGQYKVNERDNRTPVDVYTPILLEIFTSDPRSNRPYSYDREQGKLELRYRPTYKLRLNAGMKRDKLERTYQEVSETSEDSYWGELQYNPWAWIDARFKLEQLQRGATPFVQQGNYDRPEHPLMRKFNMAQRNRDKTTIEVDLSPIDRLGINLSYYTTEDEYRKSMIGLTDSEQSSLSLDLNFAINKHTNLYAFWTEDEIESEMSGANGFASMPWNAFTKDVIRTWGMGISGQINDRISYGFDYVSSDSDGDILTDSGAGEAPFPVLTTELTNTRLYMNYKLNDRWKLGLDAYKEEYKTADWFVDGIGPYDITAFLTMGETSPDYDVNVVRLFATLTF